MVTIITQFGGEHMIKGGSSIVKYEKATSALKSQDSSFLKVSGDYIMERLSELEIPAEDTDRYGKLLEESVKADSRNYADFVAIQKKDYQKRNGLLKRIRSFKPSLPQEPSTQTRCLETMLAISEKIKSNIGHIAELPEKIRQIEESKYNLDEKKQEFHKRLEECNEWLAHRDEIDGAAKLILNYASLPDEEKQRVKALLERETSGYTLNLEDNVTREILHSAIPAENNKIYGKMMLEVQFLEDSYLSVIRQLKALETWNEKEIEQKFFPSLRNLHQLMLAYGELKLRIETIGTKDRLDAMLNETETLLRDTSDIMRSFEIEEDIKKQFEATEKKEPCYIDSTPSEQSIKERINWLLSIENRESALSANQEDDPKIKMIEEKCVKT